MMHDCEITGGIMTKSRKFLTIIAASLVLTACGKSDEAGETATPQPAAGSATDAGLEVGLAEIDRDRIESHLVFLAGDEMQGRMTGTPEYDEAAAYVAALFEEFGLEPGGEDDGWFQAVPMLARRIDVESARVTFHRDGEEQAQRWQEDFVMGGDVARAETEVTAEVVFAGFGVHAPDMNYSDYDGVDVEGGCIPA
jgi:hypothetical protein